jgi:MFS family permease
MIVLGSMLSATPISALMQRFGRRFGFVLGAMGGAAGAAVGALGLATGSFVTFLAGSLLTGIYMSGAGLLPLRRRRHGVRAFRPKAISYVMAGGLVSAIIGPQLVKVTADAMVVPFLGTYLAVIAVNVVGSFLFLGLDIPKPPAPVPGAPLGRSRLELLRTPRIAVAVICAMVSYALMNLVMTSTPLAVVGCGFDKGVAADIVSAHVLAMFVPSFFTGHLIARFGAERIVAAGLLILAGAGVVAIAGVELANFFIALVLLGIGWNFGFIGATAMLAPPRAGGAGRVQGMNDMIVFGCVTLASFASGGLMNCSGGTPEAGLDGGEPVHAAVPGARGRGADLAGDAAARAAALRLPAPGEPA